MDVATRSLGAAEAEIERFIERRADKNPDPDESYMESVRAYHARQQRDHLEEQRLFHRRMLENHRQTFKVIIRKHKTALAACEAALGLTNKATKGDAA